MSLTINSKALLIKQINKGLRSPTWPRINNESSYIRLLDIFPGKGEEKLECGFLPADVHDRTVAYETLSYVWGTATEYRTVRVNERDHQVGINLYKALIRLRRPTEHLLLWVDALCINQADNEEKTHQVDMMKDIYANCATCNIWLGDLKDIKPPLTVDQVQAAFDLILLICDAAKRSPKDPVAETPASLSTIEKQRGAFAAILAMMDRPWWTRAWTVQEAVLPVHARIMWGPLSICWDAIEKASEILVQPTKPRLPFDLEEFYHGGAAPFVQRVGSVRIVRHEKSTALDLLWRFRVRQATDPLDKVYGIMGLMTHTDFPKVVSCNYKL
ncbi:hypothetical protein M426DRAFT_69678, partial [Hypoxylon sp. CI-4A]